MLYSADVGQRAPEDQIILNRSRVGVLWDEEERGMISYGMAWLAVFIISNFSSNLWLN